MLTSACQTLRQSQFLVYYLPKLSHKDEMMNIPLPWGKLSLRGNLFCLVSLPTALLLMLATHYLYELSNQEQSFYKSQLLSEFIVKISRLYGLPFGNEYSDIKLEVKSNINSLINNAGKIFTDNDKEMKDLIYNLEASTISLSKTGKIDDRIEASEWHANNFKAILFQLEKSILKYVPFEIKNNMLALIEVEWIIFILKEENRLTKYSILKFKKNRNYDQNVIKEINLLSNHYKLLLERFIASHANQDEIKLNLSKLNDREIIENLELKNLLLDVNNFDQITLENIDYLLTSLDVSLNLLTDVFKSISIDINYRIKNKVIATNSRQFIFSFITFFTLVLITFTVINIANKIAIKLKLILEFLIKDGDEMATPISDLTKGRDEISKFARQVEMLTHERKKNNISLINAKEEAERARYEADKANKAKSSFLANISHEIRTPLTGVIGISDLLSETTLTQTQRDYVDTIETSSKILLCLINDILEISKIKSGMLLIYPSPTCVRESIYDTSLIILPQLKEKGIDLKIDISRSTPYYVLVDDHRLRQVMINFISNSVKFTKKGQIIVSILTNIVSESKAIIKFSVQDSGIGISEQEQQHIFEPFVQEDISITRQFGGTGLGLSISSHLVDMMGSKIQLKSEKGHGSQFSFELSAPIVQPWFNETPPLNHSQVWVVCDSEYLGVVISKELEFYRIDISGFLTSLDNLPILFNDKENTIIIYVETKPNIAIQHESNFNSLKHKGVAVCLIQHLHSEIYDFNENLSAIVTQPILGKRLIQALRNCETKSTKFNFIKALPSKPSNYKILVVDDNTVNQRLAGLHITKMGFTYDLAANGYEAFEMFKMDEYALILMDCMMPLMDGYEATRKIRKFERKHNSATRVPIIAFSASVIADDIRKCFDAGMDDYIPKPFNAKLLQEKISKLIEIAQSTDKEVAPNVRT
ncbi:response regulator [Vibrio alginolyticus]|nr:response regulator [Vibrio alginolyticus]